MSEAERNHDPLIGATLGGLYHVERLIGVGGMGRVYEATHTHLGKAFAVKVLPEGRADKPDATERFLREAKLATKIDHDHIVKIVNFDSDDEHRLFIVMELLQGENLADRLDRGALPVDEAIEIARQTGEALQAAHDAGIVHRDLKPENIFITQKNGKDFVKVLDFGISKIKNPEHGDPKLTATDQIVGTPLYISPELARGVSSVDHRTDIYGLGVIMYEMITGSPPFTGQNHFQLLYKHGNEAPDPPSQRSKKANIPAHVESAVLCALEKDPDDRFDSMSDFRAALEGPTVPRRARTLGVPLLVAAVVAGVAFVLWPSPAPEEPSEPEVPVPAPVTEKSDDPAETSQTEAPVELVKIELNSRPGRAFVALNGEKMGRTPLTLELEPGVEATVRFSLQGYRAQEHRLVPSKDDALVVRLKQKSRPKPPPIKTDF
ncbi:MAG: serine/threonine protein kinase [Deltaproteobacteria bacterium]|nr:serine/threonine protein kinase [Deltaproteobacteria bacterium]MBW2685998.1 serine/threonine protein kinase [Deltaproteobacteria bacterium]